MRLQSASRSGLASELAGLRSSNLHHTCGGLRGLSAGRPRTSTPGSLSDLPSFSSRFKRPRHATPAECLGSSADPQAEAQPRDEGNRISRIDAKPSHTFATSVNTPSSSTWRFECATILPPQATRSTLCRNRDNRTQTSSSPPLALPRVCVLAVKPLWTARLRRSSASSGRSRPTGGSLCIAACHAPTTMTRRGDWPFPLCRPVPAPTLPCLAVAGGDATTRAARVAESALDSSAAPAPNTGCDTKCADAIPGSAKR